jgi:hypothetical protein
VFLDRSSYVYLPLLERLERRTKNQPVPTWDYPDRVTTHPPDRWASTLSS